MRSFGRKLHRASFAPHSLAGQVLHARTACLILEMYPMVGIVREQLIGEGGTFDHYM